MERPTRGAGVVGEVIMWEVPALLSPLRLGKSRRNALAWTKTTQSAARRSNVDSVTSAVAGNATPGAAVFLSGIDRASLAG